MDLVKLHVVLDCIIEGLPVVINGTKCDSNTSINQLYNLCKKMLDDQYEKMVTNLTIHNFNKEKKSA